MCVSLGRNVILSSSMLPSLLFGENNSGVHMYQFTFEPIHFCFRMWLWFRIWTKLSADRRIWRKKRHGSADLHTPIHPPLRILSRKYYREESGTCKCGQTVQQFPGIPVKARKRKFLQRSYLLGQKLSTGRNRSIWILSGIAENCIQMVSAQKWLIYCTCFKSTALLYFLFLYSPWGSVYRFLYSIKSD